MTHTYTCPNCGEEIPMEFTPGHAAPVCSNHDSPAFSDSGSSAELECEFERCPNCDAEISDDDIEREIEKAQAAYEDIANDYPDREER